MKHARKVLLPLLALILVAVAAACGNAESGNGNGEGADGGTGAGKKIRVGFSQQSTFVSYRIKQTDSIKEEAAKRGYELVFTNAQDDTAKQTSDVEDLVSQKVDYIVMSPRDFEGAATALAAAKKAGIPVILVDRLAAGEPGVDFVTYIGSNYVWEGEQAGEWAAKATGGQATIVELTGTVGASSARDRSEGFHKIVNQNDGMKVIVSQTADFSRSKAKDVMENIIQSNGDQIKLVYAHNDEMAIGASAALKAAGYKLGEDVLIVGIDGQKDAFDLVKAGEYAATVFSSPYYGPLVFDVIDKLAAGEKVETNIELPGFVVDKANVDEKMELAY